MGEASEEKAFRSRVTPIVNDAFKTAKRAEQRNGSVPDSTPFVDALWRLASETFSPDPRAAAAIRLAEARVKLHDAQALARAVQGDADAVRTAKQAVNRAQFDADMADAEYRKHRSASARAPGEEPTHSRRCESLDWYEEVRNGERLIVCRDCGGYGVLSRPIGDGPATPPQGNTAARALGTGEKP